MLPVSFQVPWMEEVMAIIFTAMVYILAHFSFKSARLWPDNKDMKSRKGCKEGMEARPKRVAGYTDASKAASFRPSQPKSWRELEGVTDSRFEGTIVCYKPEEGYGFIRCPELYKHFNRDVFLHRLQVGCFTVGAAVSFGVFLNKEGLPQAKELESLRPVQATAPAPQGQADSLTAGGYQLPASLSFSGKDASRQVKAWADVKPKIQGLSGLWAGDRASTYEVHFHLDPLRGDITVGTVLRCRPNAAPKSFHLLWDESLGQLHLSDHFTLDIDSLSKCADRAIWWRGQSQFVWQKIPQRCSWVEESTSPRQPTSWSAWEGTDPNWNQEATTYPWAPGPAPVDQSFMKRRSKVRWTRKDEALQ